MKFSPSRFVALAALCGVLLQAQAQSAPTRLRGVVTSWDGSTLHLRAPDGQDTPVQLAETARITTDRRADLSAITAGVYVGTTSAPGPDGNLRAVQIRIFPDAMRGVGEGHRLMEPSGGRTMTNATVSALASTGRNTMTNATVVTVDGGAQRMMKLQYKDGDQLVIVPADVQVLRMEVANRAALRPGAPVLVVAFPRTDGHWESERVTIGLDGYVPQ